MPVRPGSDSRYAFARAISLGALALALAGGHFPRVWAGPGRTSLFLGGLPEEPPPAPPGGASPPASSRDTAPGESAGAAERPPALDVLLRSPYHAIRASFFHAALEVPPLESARLLPPRSLLLRVSSSHVRSVSSRNIDGVPQRFNGLFHEWASFEAAWGALPRLELRGRAAIAGWDEQLDVFTLVGDSGEAIVSGEDKVITGTGSSSRHDNLSDLVLEAKGGLLTGSPFDLSLATSVKIPVARPGDLTNAGTTDVGVSLLAGWSLDRLTLHGQVGGSFPLGDQNLFEDEADVDLNPFLHAGLGASWLLRPRLSLLAQIEMNTSAFRDVEFLEDAPLTLFGGVRKAFGNFILEGGGGVGLIERSSYDWQVSVAVGYVFHRSE